MTTILAFDLGSKTGVATNVNGAAFGGTIELASDKSLRQMKKLRMDRRLDIRAIRLASYLTEICRSPDKPDYFVFEDVRFAKSLAQAQLWSTFRGVVWTVATLNGVEVECLDTSKLKKFATGFGSADKNQMAAALVRKHPERYRAETELVWDIKWGTLLDDNAVDALHLLDWAVQTLNK